MRARRRGAIVNVSSAAGHVPLPWLVMYSASKSALNSMTSGLRAELAGSGVNVFAVWPGYIRTRFGDNRLSGDVPAFMRQPASVVASPEECARAIVRGVERDSSGVFTPLSARLFVSAHRLFPGLVERELARRHSALGKMSQHRHVTENVE
jgi:short-subunit dehydrogenase